MIKQDIEVRMAQMTVSLPDDVTVATSARRGHVQLTFDETAPRKKRELLFSNSAVVDQSNHTSIGKVGVDIKRPDGTFGRESFDDQGHGTRNPPEYFVFLSN